MNNFLKYNSKIKYFLKTEGNINFKDNQILDKNNNELRPYNKHINIPEKEELMFFQNVVVPNIIIHTNLLVKSVKAVAGGSYSLILYASDSENNLIIKIQERSKISDVEAYLKITNNLQRKLSPYIIKMYGYFKSFDKFESFDTTIKYIPPDKHKKQLLNVYILFENADGNIRDLTKYLFELKNTNYNQWTTILKNFLFSMISAIKYLHETGNSYAMLHLDLRPENIVYTKHIDDIEFKLIDIGSVIEYKFETSTDKERLRGSGVYSKYIYKNSPYRDYYNLWLTICEVFDLYNFKSYNFINSRESIRELVSNCHKQTEIISKTQPNFLKDLFMSSDDVVINLENLKNSINIFRSQEKLNFNIQKSDLLKYTSNFVLY